MIKYRYVFFLITSSLLLSQSAQAHVDFKDNTYQSGSHASLTLEVADGCENGDTTQVDVVMPASVKHLMLVGAKLGNTSPKGWVMKVNKLSGKTFIRAKGPAIKVSDEKPLTLNFMATLPTGKDQVLSFPTTQYCGKEINSWVDPRPGVGLDSPDGSFPIPSIAITSKTSKNTSSGMSKPMKKSMS